MSIQVTYPQILACRADANSILFAELVAGRYLLTAISKNGVEMVSEIALNHPLIDVFIAEILPLCGWPVEQEEVRFVTHDFSDVRDWDGRTLGDPAAWYAGGRAIHPHTGEWVNETGAYYLYLYEQSGNPLYLFAAKTQSIQHLYDDVNYQWKDENGLVLAKLVPSEDYTQSTSWWQASDGVMLVEYVVPETPGDVRDGKWMRRDAGGQFTIDVTSSRWKVLPYPGYKIKINQAWLMADTAVQFNGMIVYRAYSYVPGGHPKLPEGAPGGIYNVRNWVYRDLAAAIAGMNMLPFEFPHITPGHTSPVIVLGFDYQTTVPTYIDSRYSQSLVIGVDNHQRCTNTLGAHGRFICVNIRSF